MPVSVHAPAWTLERSDKFLHHNAWVTVTAEVVDFGGDYVVIEYKDYSYPGAGYKQVRLHRLAPVTKLVRA